MPARPYSTRHCFSSDVSCSLGVQYWCAGTRSGELLPPQGQNGVSGKRVSVEILTDISKKWGSRDPKFYHFLPSLPSMEELHFAVGFTL